MGVAFGRSHRETRGSVPDRRTRRTGFTLVEMLVVIGIIVLLAGILLPVLSHVWESANRTKCASNLKEIGKTCEAFANRHGGYYPMCYRMRDTASATYPYYCPFCISQGGASGMPDLCSNDASQNYWGVFGTSWIAWQDCGANLGIFSCPSSSGNGAYAVDMTTAAATGTAHPEWGAVIWTDYMYVGSLSYFIAPNPSGQTGTTYAGSLCGYPLAGNLTTPQVIYSKHSVGHWGTAVPAVQANAGFAQQGGRTYTSLTSSAMVKVQTDTAVLAADMCFQWSVTAGVSSGVKTNHPIERRLPGSTTLYWVPDFQNVLYADGSVSSHGQEDYLQPLNTDAVNSTGNGTPMDTGPNWSMVMSDPTTGGIGGYCYWGENEAIPPPVPSVNVTALPTPTTQFPSPPTPPSPPVLQIAPPAPPTTTAPQSNVPFNQ